MSAAFIHIYIASFVSIGGVWTRGKKEKKSSKNTRKYKRICSLCCCFLFVFCIVSFYTRIRFHFVRIENFLIVELLNNVESVALLVRISGVQYPLRFTSNNK